MQSTVRAEWRNGRYLVIAASFGVGLSSAPIYSLGAFIEPLHAAFGWNRTQIVLAQAIFSLVVTGVSPPVGALLDRYGPRRLALSGTVIASLALAMLSRLQGSYPLYLLTWGVLALGVGLASSLVWLRAVVERFSQQRGLAMSVALCGSNIAGAIAPVLVIALIGRAGWRLAYVGLALYLLLSIFPLAYGVFYGSRELVHAGTQPERAAAAPLDSLPGLETAAAVRSREFWLLAAAFLLGGGAITSFVVHMIPMLTDRGMAPLLAASIVSGMNIAAVLGRVASGFLMDRVFATRLAAIAMLLPVPACLLLLNAPATYTYAGCGAVLIGLSTGAEFNMISFLAARYFGLRRLGVLAGILFACFSAGSILMPPLTGMLFTLRGDYDAAIQALAGAFAIAGAALFLCRRYPDLPRAGSGAG